MTARRSPRLSVALDQLDLFTGQPIPHAPVDDEDDDGPLTAAEEAQRPRTRRDCLAGGINAQRPCPWASCSAHLLLELTAPNGDHAVAGEVGGLVVRHAVVQPQPSLVYNRTRRRNADGSFPPPPKGRPPTLAPDASAKDVAAFQARALAQLEPGVMPATCVLDITDEFPTGITSESAALALGISTEAVGDAFKEAAAQWRGIMYAAGLKPPETVTRTLGRRAGETPAQAIARAQEHAAGTWWPRVVDEQPEASEGRWTWHVYEAVDAVEGLRLAADDLGKERAR